MSLPAAGTGLAITNPLVLYRALVATNRITPDPAQHRLAIHLQKLYDRLIDYEPTIEYRRRLNQISKAVGEPAADQNVASDLGSRGVWQSLIAKKEHRDSLALTRTLTSSEAALHLDSPKGLMLHGEVGTGKSMLIDLFADCLPNRKKRRWHFNTFMLESFAKLEQLRRERLSKIPPSVASADVQDYSMLWLARDMINTSPILFLDEFQLPDRAASKIMTNLMTSFFQLGGVLIATSNRMPEELDKAAGTTYAPPPSRMESLTWRFGVGGRRASGKSENLFAGQSEFAGFLEVLKARCEVWEMGGGKDYRRQEVDFQAPKDTDAAEGLWQLDEHQDLQRAPGMSGADSAVDVSMATANAIATEIEQQASASSGPPTPVTTARGPHHYIITPSAGASEEEVAAHAKQLAELSDSLPTSWVPSTMRVYGRTIIVPRTSNGTTSWTFAELCGSALGPADYITLASTYHTLILAEVPVLSLLQKNEARRFITLLDAMYEARCKLFITASAGPDELFFPDAKKPGESNDADAVYPETLSEVYQDATAPFRPNILGSNPDYSEPEPDYTHSRYAGMLAPDSLEDDPPNRIRRLAERGERGPVGPDDDTRMHGLRQGLHPAAPNFGNTGVFTGEDEKFAYKRARSRIWEMCGRKWWARDEAGWHKPVPVAVRRWEGLAGPDPVAAAAASVVGSDGRVGGGMQVPDVGVGGSREVDEQADEVMFRHGASPFRTAREPPPKFSWTHVWGTMKWGKKAGAWGQGVEGLQDRKKEKKDKGGGDGVE
ncbi:hypothetical protein MBLNU459_g2556t1 [Dothideomycetes sp. NU459]